LAACNSSFKWRRASEEEGHPTGYMWQTGVHRKDVELYGSTLSLDRLGRPWPLLTIAMVDVEKKVCVASEAIVISERVDAYAWVMRSLCVELTPGFELIDIKAIFMRMVSTLERLCWRSLESRNTCKIVMGHMRLLNADIGA
jgi:hypothetical protein